MAAQPLLYTAAHLDRWPATGGLLQPPARLAVIGDPVAHSLSPEMHNPALRALGIPATYVRLHLRPGEFFPAIPQLARLGFTGVNCTIPHKFLALQCVDHLDPDAKITGAVNTIIFQPDGSTYGRNSDSPGFLRAVSEEFGRDVRDLRILIVGAGGGAGAAVATVCAMQGCPALYLTNRSLSKLPPLRQQLENHQGVTNTTIIPWEHGPLSDLMPHIDLIVNCTSLGMNPEDSPVIPHSAIAPHHLIFDMVYKPLVTPLLAAAADAGARAINGLPMLLWQGAQSLEWWFEKPAPTTIMRQALQQATGWTQPTQRFGR